MVCRDTKKSPFENTFWVVGSRVLLAVQSPYVFSGIAISDIIYYYFNYFDLLLKISKFLYLV